MANRSDSPGVPLSASSTVVRPAHLTYEALEPPSGVEYKSQPTDAGFRIASLERGERLNVSTHNTQYSLVMINPTFHKILIRGGRHFPEPTEACLVGTMDEDRRRADRIALGRKLEIVAGNRLLVTSPIVTIERDLERPVPPSPRAR